MRNHPPRHPTPAPPPAKNAHPPAPSPAPLPAPSTSPLPQDTDLHQPADGKGKQFPALMAHRPLYVLVGPEVPNVKFQISTKVPLLFPDGRNAPEPVLSNVYFGYTQMSLWDIHHPGTATIDTTFQPELFFVTRTAPVDFPGFRASGVGVQVGVQHESNGRSGEESRNANYFYLEPTLYFGDRKALHAEVSVK